MNAMMEEALKRVTDWSLAICVTAAEQSDLVAYLRSRFHNVIGYDPTQPQTLDSVVLEYGFTRCGLIHVESEFASAVLKSGRETIMAFSPVFVTTGGRPTAIKMYEIGETVEVDDSIIYVFSDAGPVPYPKYRDRGDYHWRRYTSGKTKPIVDPVVKYICEQEHKRILDIGCGDGLYTAMLPGAIGLEQDTSAVWLARMHGVTVHRMKAHQADTLGCFDAVCMFDAFEHMPLQATLLSQLNRVAPNLYILNPDPKPGNVPWHTREFTGYQLVEFASRCGWLVKHSMRVPLEGESAKTLIHFV